jgi:hypothetical protein
MQVLSRKNRAQAKKIVRESGFCKRNAILSKKARPVAVTTSRER